MRADRLLSILLILQARGRVTTAVLATELEVSRRTVLRDIEALSIAGVPVYAEGGHGGGIMLDEGYRTTLTGLNEPEVRALFLNSGGGLLAQLGLGDAASTLHRKLALTLPAGHQRAVAHMRQRVYIDPLYWWHASDAPLFWTQLLEAIDTDRVVQVRYESYQGAVSERELEPYSLVAKSGAWYLLAKHKGALKTYRVARIHALNGVDRHFVRDPEFDLETHWKTHLVEFQREVSAYSFSVRVHPDQVTHIQRMMPGRATPTHTDEHTGWVVCACVINNQDEALSIVFGLRDHAEIVAPDTLRTALHDACAQLATRLSATED